MSTRLLLRLILATVVLSPTLVAAAPQTAPQTPAAAPPAPSEWISIVPVDSEHARVTIRRSGDATDVICEAKSATISYTADGMVVDLKGPGTMTMSSAGAIAFGSARVVFTNGKFSGFQFMRAGQLPASIR